VSYSKEKGLIKSITSPLKSVTPFRISRASDFPEVNLVNAGIIVKENDDIAKAIDMYNCVKRVITFCCKSWVRAGIKKYL